MFFSFFFFRFERREFVLFLFLGAMDLFFERVKRFQNSLLLVAKAGKQ